jgi:hypothetical protein
MCVRLYLSWYCCVGCGLSRFHSAWVVDTMFYRTTFHGNGYCWHRTRVTSSLWELVYPAVAYHRMAPKLWLASPWINMGGSHKILIMSWKESRRLISWFINHITRHVVKYSMLAVFHLWPCRSTHYVLPKRRFTSFRLHHITSQRIPLWESEISYSGIWCWQYYVLYICLRTIVM